MESIGAMAVGKLTSPFTTKPLPCGLPTGAPGTVTGAGFFAGASDAVPSGAAMLRSRGARDTAVEEYEVISGIHYASATRRRKGMAGASAHAQYNKTWI